MMHTIEIQYTSNSDKAGKLKIFNGLGDNIFSCDVVLPPVWFPESLEARAIQPTINSFFPDSAPHLLEHNKEFLNLTGKQYVNIGNNIILVANSNFAYIKTQILSGFQGAFTIGSESFDELLKLIPQFKEVHSICKKKSFLMGQLACKIDYERDVGWLLRQRQELNWQYNNPFNDSNYPDTAVFQRELAKRVPTHTLLYQPSRVIDLHHVLFSIKDNEILMNYPQEVLNWRLGGVCEVKEKSSQQYVLDLYEDEAKTKWMANIQYDLRQEIKLFNGEQELLLSKDAEVYNIVMKERGSTFMQLQAIQANNGHTIGNWVMDGINPASFKIGHDHQVASNPKRLWTEVSVRLLEDYQSKIMYQELSQLQQAPIETSHPVKNVPESQSADMPKSCQEILVCIDSFRAEILLDKLPHQQCLEVQNIVENTLPQVLLDYKSISPRYREKLKTLGQDPDVLLQESLQEICQKMEDMADLCQGANMTNLRIRHRYLKSLA